MNMILAAASQKEAIEKAYIKVIMIQDIFI